MTTETGQVGDWRHRAACRDVEPELFQPPADGGQAFEAQVAAAKSVCERCCVRADCLAFALAALPFGIAGGLTEDERHRLRARSPRRSAVNRCPVGGSRAEIAAAGRAAIRAGHEVRDVAREFGVAERTAARWAARVRADGQLSTGEGKPRRQPGSPPGLPSTQPLAEGHEHRKDAERR